MIGYIKLTVHSGQYSFKIYFRDDRTTVFTDFYNDYHVAVLSLIKILLDRVEIRNEDE